MKNNKSTDTHIKMNKEDWEKLKASADEKDLSVSHIVRQLIQEYLEKEYKMKVRKNALKLQNDLLMEEKEKEGKIF